MVGGYTDIGNMLVGSGGLRAGQYELFDDRTSPWMVDFEPLLSRASTLKSTAKLFYEKMVKEHVLDGDRPVFLLGSPTTGIILASAIACVAYSSTSGQDRKGVDLRVGFFAKEQDMPYISRSNADRERDVDRKMREYPRAKKANVISIRPAAPRGEDLVRTGVNEAIRLSTFQPEVDSVMAVGYGGIPWAVGMALELEGLGKDVYLAFERFTGRGYDPERSSLFVGSINPSGNFVVVRPSTLSEPTFQGQLQDGDHVYIIDDVAARGHNLMEEARKTSMQNPRSRVNGVIVGVDRKEREGDTRLGESLAAAKIDLLSLTDAEELLRKWNEFPDPAKRPREEEFVGISNYQRDNRY